MVSWDINSKTVSSLTKDNKEISSIVRNSDNTTIYEKADDTILIKFTGGSFSSYSSYKTFSRVVGEIIIDWGDGNKEVYNNNKIKHTYSISGNYIIKIKGEVVTINSSAFSQITGITSIKLSQSVKYLSDMTFNACMGLTDINLNNVQSLSSSLFQGCTSLTNINIPPSITYIGTYVFWGCTNLERVILNWKNSQNIVNYNSNWLTNANANCNFIIPQGTTALYEAKGYPSNKLVEISE